MKTKDYNRLLRSIFTIGWAILGYLYATDMLEQEFGNSYSIVVFWCCAIIVMIVFFAFLKDEEEDKDPNK